MTQEQRSVPFTEADSKLLVRLDERMIAVQVSIENTRINVQLAINSLKQDLQENYTLKNEHNYLQRELTSLKEEVRDYKSYVERNYTQKLEFTVVKGIAFGLVGAGSLFLLNWVFGGLVKLGS